MQNLFATNNMQGQTQPRPHVPQNVNIEDFNTMQNLFATNNFNKPDVQRTEDPFSVLTDASKSSVPPMMNTYGGGKQ